MNLDNEDTNFQNFPSIGIKSINNFKINLNTLNSTILDLNQFSNFNYSSIISLNNSLNINSYNFYNLISEVKNFENIFNFLNTINLFLFNNLELNYFIETNFKEIKFLCLISIFGEYF